MSGLQDAFPYQYDDGVLIHLEAGAHGLSPEFSEFEVPWMFGQETRTNGYKAKLDPKRIMPLRALEGLEDGELDEAEMERVLRLQHSYHAGGPACAARQSTNSNSSNLCGSYPVVEFIFMGRSHRYYVVSDLWQRLAPLWRANLAREGRFLIRSIQVQREVLAQFIVDSANLGGWMTYLIDGGKRSVKRLWSEVPNPPKIEDFDPITDRTLKAWKSCIKEADTDYYVLHHAGLEFMRARYELAKVTGSVFAHIESMIRSAEQGAEAAEGVESTAFKVLELYGEARFVGNSHGLMIYRIGLLATRTTARGFGDLYLADSNFDSVWQQTKDLLVKDAPGILAKWMASLITRKLHSENSLPNPAATKRSVSEEVTEKVIRYLLSPILDITFWQLYSRRRSENPETVDQFAPRFGQKVSEDTVRLVADLIVMGFADSASDAKQRERREDICELVLTVLELAYGEFQALRATAEKEKKSVWEVWTGDVGFHLLRLLSTAARDFAMIWAGKKIKASVARDYRGKQLAKLIEDAVRDTFDEKKVSKPTTEPLHISKEEQKELRRGFDEKAPFPAVSKDVGAEDTHDGGKAKPLDKTIVEQKMPPRTGREANDKMLQEVIKETRNKELEKKKQAAAFKDKQHRRDTSMRATSR